MNDTDQRRIGGNTPCAHTTTCGLVPAVAGGSLYIIKSPELRIERIHTP